MEDEESIYLLVSMYKALASYYLLNQAVEKAQSYLQKGAQIAVQYDFLDGKAVWIYYLMAFNYMVIQKKLKEALGAIKKAEIYFSPDQEESITFLVSICYMHGWLLCMLSNHADGMVYLKKAYNLSLSRRYPFF